MRTFSKNPSLNKKVSGIVERLAQLQTFERYRGALIFGSASRGEFNMSSDLDIQVLVSGTSHASLLHPIIEGIKFDLSFYSKEELEKQLLAQINSAKRPPFQANSYIIFDKDEVLKNLKERADRVVRPEVDDKDMTIFSIINEKMKVDKVIDSDPDTALWIMHTGIKGIIKSHYKLNQRWDVSNKKELDDLKLWDSDLASLLVKYVNETACRKKYELWNQIIKHVLSEAESDKNVDQIGCDCETCMNDLNRVIELVSPSTSH